jgi:vacuolar protein-sorting-associated protein 4
MAIDLIGVLGDRLENTLAKARKLVEQGDLQKAAATYAQAAKLMKHYAESADSAGIKMKRLADASKLQSCAEELRKGKVLSSQAEVPNVEAAYAQAAKLMEQFAESADNADIKEKRLTDASEPQSCTEQMQLGKVLSSQSEVSNIADDKEIAPEEDDYTENAKSLITQATISWNEIAGLDDVKRFVKESYALSLAQRPDGVGLPRVANLLLYGPPGTGKTLIAAAISKGLEATFFSCKVSDMLSIYFGESSKLIAAIFELATKMSPSVIFLDDFESIVPSRDSESSGSERRVLTELLACMDGFEHKGENKLVLVIAATNKPWLIDQAILSRFGKLAYIDLPDKNARQRIFELHLTEKGYKVKGSLEEFANKTAGYSGREIEQVCKELVRAMISKTNPDLVKVADKGKKALESYTLKIGKITVAALDRILSQMSPMTDKNDSTRYEQWARKV